MTGHVSSLECGVTRLGSPPEFGPSPVTSCNRFRHHDGDHRGPEAGTGRLVSWPTFTGHHVIGGWVDEVAETWESNPDGWLSDPALQMPAPLEQRDELAGWWHAVAVAGPWLVWGTLVAAAWLLPALVLIAWKAAL